MSSIAGKRGLCRPAARVRGIKTARRPAQDRAVGLPIAEVGPVRVRRVDNEVHWQLLAHGYLVTLVLRCDVVAAQTSSLEQVEAHWDARTVGGLIGRSWRAIHNGLADRATLASLFRWRPRAAEADGSMAAGAVELLNDSAIVSGVQSPPRFEASTDCYATCAPAF